MRRIALTVAVGCLAVSAALAGSPKGAAAAISHGALHVSGNSQSALVHSLNWSGIAVTGQVYSQVAGSWTVPTVKAELGNRYASDWVGIGGYTGGSVDLIQAGTSEQYAGGHASYNAWTEILPQAEVVIPGFTVHPGDAMTVVITKGTGSAWKIVVTDSTESESFTKNLTYHSAESSAEWIHEAPKVGGSIVDIATTTNADFDHGTVNGSTAIGSAGAQHRIQLVGASAGDTKATPSKLDSDKDGIAVADGTTVPKPPAS